VLHQSEWLLNWFAVALVYRTAGRVGDGGRLAEIFVTIVQTAEFGPFAYYYVHGHGIGSQMHQEPEVPNYGKAGHGQRLRPGMTLAIEPMINEGRADVVWLDDDWTVVTADGSLSAHYENTILITDGEPEILTI